VLTQRYRTGAALVEPETTESRNDININSHSALRWTAFS
jgi:hypothetical protein